MTEKTAKDLEVRSYQVYSLDRCLKCLNKLNLGDRCFCAVTLKCGKNPKDGR
ncbi:MAG: hypothetical protein LBT97_06275 [Planctomycetota bacterium]|nr:hypothetical protein [Planctomycetota bacterium]